MQRSRVAVVVVLLGGLAYSWWAAGLRPFTALSYVAVAVPVAVLVALACVGAGRRRRVPPGIGARHVGTRRGPRPVEVAPLVAVVGLACALEAVGLALGGRSPHVPTASTVVDHLLAWHAVRAVLFFLWLAAAFVPVTARARRRPPTGVRSA